MPASRYRRRGGKDPIDGALASPFNFFDPHDTPGPYHSTDSIIVASIDPGIKNCGLYVVKINLNDHSKRSLYLSRMEFDQDESHYTSSIKILTKLEEKTKIFSKCQYIVIEKQMTMSIPNTRMGQHLITFFSTFLRNKGKRPRIVEIVSTAKTRVLKCPKGMKKPEYKKWCHRKAIDLLEQRDEPAEEQFITCLECAKKKDDMGDTICQAEAFYSLIISDLYDYPKPIKGKPEEN